ncbi:putative transcription factor C2H2 family [Medicago truncatula]|uniref:RBR-type E3 ubiquitin transferase n=1 Tax=Medicago truncatula TaxID=3880 RepID=A0A072V7Q4_MEDTR|nr:E3 ubiquitin-protein ligase RNF14 [Medicago truncatula]KEH37671.1 zinc finger, C3HC4 type (RING finger) protein, putative [Medicago truncatula]RHN73735.1 putative transcription factor C2H2 family [Medicago truncatula]
MAPESRARKKRNIAPAEVMDFKSFRSLGKRPIPDVINLFDEEDEGINIFNFTPKNNSYTKPKTNNLEKGESSNSSITPFVCEICTDTKTMKDAFYISGCSHAYCSDCVVKYINSKLEDNIVNIQCPVLDCEGLLDPQFCRPILSDEVYDRWGLLFCEALFKVSKKFYCPFADCSALLINDRRNPVKNSECPNCNRMFYAQCMAPQHDVCARCKVPRQQGIECSEFEKLNVDRRKKEDDMFMCFAKDTEWRQCPKCRIYVAKSEGSIDMTCRLSFLFNILLVISLFFE